MRRSLTQLQRARIFDDAHGLCHLCGLKIQAGQPWDVEHIIPLAMGGEDGGDNLRPAHKTCHAPKTAADVKAIAKVKRIRAKHIGAKQPSRFPKPPPGTRWDWKLGRRVFDKETA